jgi:CheY-like chemotaxis protein
VNAPESHKRYVLVVDSNVDDLYYTCMLLRRFGYSIVTSYTAEKAVEFMTVAPPAAIVADADLSGSPLFLRLRQDPRFFDTPLLLLSWWPNAALEDRARKGEFAAYIRKPVSVEEFYANVQTAIEKGPRRNIRIATYLPVKLEDGLDGGEGYATVLSEYGMFFRTFMPRSVNARIPTVVTIKDRLLNLEAVVLYVIMLEEGPFKEPGMGMKFVNITRADRELIAAFILEQIEEGIRR